MANNRLYVRNKKTGQTWFLTKTMGTGWYPLGAGALARINEILESDEGHGWGGQTPSDLEFCTECEDDHERTASNKPGPIPPDYFA